MDRWRNDEVGRKLGVREKVSDRMDRKVLKRLRYVERTSEERLSKRVYEAGLKRRRK